MGQLKYKFADLNGFVILAFSLDGVLSAIIWYRVKKDRR